jgi:hypothetical protein
VVGGRQLEVVLAGGPRRVRDQDGSEARIEPGEPIHLGSAVRFVELDEPDLVSGIDRQGS